MFEKLEENIKKTIDRKTFYQVTALIDRYLWLRYPPRVKVKQATYFKLEVGTWKNGKPKFKTMARCPKCLSVVECSDIEIDHLEPRMDVLEPSYSIDDYARRTLCDIKNLQALCKKCHREKSIDENSRRRKS
jgi:5-methylcytosine-specific restriction endonuclease McrA